MIHKFRDGIIRSINFYRKYSEVEELKVFDSKGEEVFGHEEGPPEARLAEVLRTGNPVHFYKQVNNRNVMAFITPVENKPECQSCHGKNEPLVGALLLSFSQEEMEQSIWQNRRRLFTVFGLIAIGIGAMTFLAVNRVLVKRLKPIQRGAGAIEKGDFSHRIPVESYDEIGELTSYVNQMAQRLELFFRELEDKNKQLTEQFGVISRSQKEWQVTFDCITDPVAVIDHQRLIRANRALKKAFKEYFHDQGDMIDFLSHGTGPFSPEDRVSTTQEIRHQGTGRVFEKSSFPYYSLEGNFAGSVVILKDVSEKKEDEVRLIMNERLAALGQMASGIAHEINTPLATISACNESLLRRVEKENLA
jgi:nitrogen fixation/metabolism regulation signal transduction histidine kinase